jgi:predicted S18 family serine protease
MRKLFALVVLTGCLAAPSFARDVVAHSVKVAGKAVAVTAKGTAKGVAAVGKFLF